ncbi:MAG: hypothetical protein LC121_00660 [Anaerolineae bacterium]|nr:hypothetical protein [Anaerolineae bacterium]
MVVDQGGDLGIAHGLVVVKEFRRASAAPRARGALRQMQMQAIDGDRLPATSMTTLLQHSAVSKSSWSADNMGTFESTAL